MKIVRFTLALLGIALSGALTAASCRADVNVTRATLANGLQVVVVRDPLAPVVTTMLNYKAGSNEQQYDGQAHALEHMMFRGAKTLSESQLADISELLGGDNDADTQAEVTQFYFTAPSQYLDLLLRMEASRMRDASIAQKEWNIEKG
ncbi:MAG TPA: insulinase family protein, partial [Candidatus Baltobacteraceae bacterium]|nr:insulinase family protein [Candidatus Baltobacteraceae bacterium]